MPLLGYRARGNDTPAPPRAKGGEIPLVVSKNTEYTPTGLRMYIATEGGAEVTSKTVYTNCQYRLVDANGVILLDTVGTGVWARIRGRGNTTWAMPKKPWKVKLTNSAKMLNLPTSKDWALLANYADQTRVKNYIAYWMFSKTSQAWTPRSFPVEVWFNGRYDGLYQLIESVEIGPNRNNITDIKDADTTGRNLTGGYRVEIEIREAQLTGWYTRLGQPFIPDDPDLTVPAQLTYAKARLQTLEDRLFAENFTDPVLGYRPLIDIDTWCDWYLVTETIASTDSGWGASIRIHWDRDAVDGTPSPIKLGPPWDYDLTMGAASDFAVNEFIVRVGAFPIARMLEDPAFVTRLRQRWQVLKAAWENPNDSVYTYATALWTSLTAARERDNDRWARFLSPISEVTTWLQTRIAWLDTQIMTAADTTPPAAPSGLTIGAIVAGGRTISWDAPSTPPMSGGDVVGFRVRANGVIVGQTQLDSNRALATSVVVVGVADGATWTLEARDRYGNWSTSVGPA